MLSIEAKYLLPV
jgi:transposase